VLVVFFANLKDLRFCLLFLIWQARLAVSMPISLALLRSSELERQLVALGAVADRGSLLTCKRCVWALSQGRESASVVR